VQRLPLEENAELYVTSSRAFTFHAGWLHVRGEHLLIDPGLLPDEIDALAGHVGDSPGSARTLLTHGHWDHVLGPERMKQIPSIAHVAFPMEEADPRRARVSAQVTRLAGELGIARAEPFSLPRPDATFAETDKLTIGEVPVALQHAPGHAEDHTVMYLVESGVLWSADMLSDDEIPYVCHSLVEYESTLEKLSKLQVRTLIPTHGSVTSEVAEIRRRFDADRSYLGELHRRVAKAISESRSVEETVELCDGMTLPHRDQNERPHRMNIEQAYCELGGEGEASRFGWNRLHQQ